MSSVSGGPIRKVQSATPATPMDAGPYAVDGLDLLRQLPELVCLIDANAMIRWANRDRLTGRPYSDFVIADDRPRLLAVLHQPDSIPAQIDVRVTYDDQPASAVTLWISPRPESGLFLVCEHYRERRDRQLAVTLQEIATIISSTLQLGEMSQLLMNHLQRVLQYDSSALFLIEEGQLRIYDTRGHPDTALKLEKRDFADLPTFREIMSTHRPLQIGDTQVDPRWTQMQGLEYIRSWLGVPLLARSRLIGVLGLDSMQPNAYTEEDVRLVEALAAQVSVPIDNARLHEEAARRADHMAALNEVAATVSQSLDLEQTLRIALDKALDVVGVEAGAISLIDEAAGELAIRVHRGWRYSELAQGMRIRLGEGLSGRAAVTGEVVVTGDVRGDPRLAVPRFAEEGVQAMVLAPMRARGRVVGIFSVMHYTPYDFSTGAVEFLKALADQIGVAIDNARLYEAEYTRRRISEALRQISGALASTLDLDQAFNVTLQHLPEVVSYDRASIVLFESGHARIHAAHGFDSIAAMLRPTLPLPPDSLLGRLLREKRSLIVLGEQAQLGFALEPSTRETAEVKSWMGAPLIVRHEAVGALVVESLLDRAYIEEDAATLFTLANHLATAVENARLFAAESRRSMQMALINEIARRTTATLDLNELLGRAANLIHQRFGYRSVGLFLVDRQLGEAILRSAAGEWADLAETGYRQAIARGLIGRAVSTGQPVISNNVAGDPNYIPLVAEETSHGSALVVPLRHKEVILGALAVQHQRTDFFQPDVVDVVQTLADQLSIAIDNARLYQETTRRLYELAVLHEMSVAATSTLDFDEVSQRTVAALQHALGFDYLALFLLDAAGKGLTLYATSKLEERAARHARIELGHGLVGAAAQSGQPINCGDVRLDARFLSAIPDVRSELAIPLKVGERVIGVLDGQSTQLNAFTQDDVRLLLTVAGQTAVILDKARLHQETQQRLREMTTLQTFAQQISASLDLSEVLDSIVITLKQVLGCRGVSLAMLIPDTQTLEIRAAAGIQAKWKREAKLKLGEGISGRAAANAQPIYVADTYTMPDFIFFDPIVRSLLCVPLTLKERVIGTLTVDQAVPDAFTKNDERLLAIAAAQAAVAIENAQLYEELKERARRLEQAYRELQEADRLKDELVQNVSHELRTPLTFVKGYVELLLEEDMGPINERQRESLSIVAEKTNSVTRLVSDIIFLEQIERESLQLSAVQMADLARLALQGCEVTAAAAGIHLHADLEPELPPVTADRDRVNQVFDNLLANAIKFSPQGGAITIGLRRQGEAVLASVSDQGIGIPHEQLHRVFERFYQVDGSATRRFGGAGVGLAIVKRIVEAHGGRVWVESELSQGSTFYFSVPLAPPLGRAGGIR
ncbi:MAG TPA: GAF domain-containing protein [Anaerolineae bacterium]|nr:GAF domain-containing protein [Anaerolineae bacterium]